MASLKLMVRSIGVSRFSVQQVIILQGFVRALSTLLVLGLGCFGCTFSDGSGWTTLTANLSGAFVVGDEHAHANASFTTDNGYDISVEEMHISVGDVRIMGATSPSNPTGVTEFDPANPPPGYTLCHGGHCHSADGSLVSYEELEAGLASGELSSRARDQKARMAVDGRLDLFSHTPLSTVSAELGAMDVEGFALEIYAFSMRGTVDIANGLEIRTVELVVTVELDQPLVLETDLRLTINRDSQEAIVVDLELLVSQTLFDGVVYDNLAIDGETITISANRNQTVYEIVVARLTTTVMHAQYTGSGDIEPGELEDGHEDVDEHGELHETIEHACLHFTTGAAHEVTAAADAESAPEVHPGHERLHVTFVGLAGEKGGYLKLHLDEPGHAIVMLDTAVSLRLTDDQGNEAELHTQENDPEACDSVATVIVFEVEQAGLFTLTFGPGPQADVQMVIEAGEHAHEHGDE